MNQRLFPWLLLLLILALGELCAAFFFSQMKDRFHFPAPEELTASAEEISRARRTYSRELGWELAYDTPCGERPRVDAPSGADVAEPLDTNSNAHESNASEPTEDDPAFLAAFGDSFVHGDEVDHGETWAQALSEILQEDVFNYGVSAYGMDQALLRFERDFACRPARHAMFGFITWDIERNLSVYWKFQQAEGGFASTKPRFRIDPATGTLFLIPNPIAAPQDMERLADPAFIREIAALDDWSNRNDLPRLGFPHLRFLVHPSIWRVALRRGNNPDLWRQEEPRRVAEEILLRFHRGAAEQGARPWIVHFPVVWELIAFSESGALPSSVEALQRLCREQGLNCLSLTEKLGRRSLQEIAPLFTQGLDGGHYSPAGNREIARILADEIKSAP